MLTYSKASQLLSDAVSAASDMGVRVCVIIVDGSGQFITGGRMDGAYLSSPTIATAKAFTAINFKVPTTDMIERLPDVSYRNHIALTDTRLTFLPGGIPIFDADGILLGAIGVSGGTAAQDVEICQAALAKM